MAGKHIVLITTGQPSTNPRLVKEADTLAANGYQVTVLYAYWNHWATETDRHLLRNKCWAAIRVGGSPLTDRLPFLRSKVFNFLYKKLLKYWVIFEGMGFPLPFWLQEAAISRATANLKRASKHLKADLYLAHNLGAIPAAVYAAKANQSLAGFDAEDYHRNEVTNNQISLAYKLTRALEDRFIPKLDYFTISSPMIKEFYDQHYQTPSVVIRNLFPRFHNKNAKDWPDNKRLKLCWFSQTIGPNRGLELLVSALDTLKPETFELHLLGDLKPGFAAQLAKFSSRNLQDLNVYFHAPVNPDELSDFLSAFDIGIASEPAFCINNDAALSNKVFSYIQCGLALLLSDTSAQQALLHEYPGMGKIYKKDCKEDLTAAIQHFIDGPTYLEAVKKHNYKLGQEILNWEQEQKKFLYHIKHTLDCGLVRNIDATVYNRPALTAGYRNSITLSEPN